MTDHEDLIRRLEERDAGCANADNIYRHSIDAIKELVADYKGQGEVLIREVNAKLEAQMRAEKAEAALAAARAALRVMHERVEKADEFLMDDGHGEGSRVRECLADAIESARRNDHGQG